MKTKEEILEEKIKSIKGLEKLNYKDIKETLELLQTKTLPRE